MTDLSKASKGIAASALELLNPDGKQGMVLMALNAAGMIFAALSNTWAAASDKNTSKEDKKVLVPAGFATGAANIALYYLMTDKLIKCGEIAGETFANNLKADELSKNALQYAKNKIKKADRGLFNKDEFIQSMKNDLITTAKDGSEIATDLAKNEYKIDLKAGGGVLGSFAGAVIGCAILTPIIRDITAYFVQKKMEKKSPDLQNQPYRPYFDPTHLKVNVAGRNRDLTLKNYMAFTRSHNGMKI